MLFEGPIRLGMATLAAGLLLYSSGCTRWRDVGSEEAGFSVQMPGAPESAIESLATRSGAVTLHCKGLERHWLSAPALYIVAYSDPLTAAAGQPDEWLRLTRDKFVDAGGETPWGHKQAHVRSERAIELQGHPGLELWIEEPGGRAARARIYYSGERVYSLYVVDDDARAHRFLDSLVFR
jgi:hypothetical protein